MSYEVGRAQLVIIQLPERLIPENATVVVFTEVREAGGRAMQSIQETYNPTETVEPLENHTARPIETVKPPETAKSNEPSPETRSNPEPKPASSSPSSSRSPPHSDRSHHTMPKGGQHSSQHSQHSTSSSHSHFSSHASPLPSQSSSQGPSSPSDPDASETPAPTDNTSKKPVDTDPKDKSKLLPENGEKPIKNIEDVAKQIANELIPEKFNFLILLANSFRQHPLPQVVKEEKPQSEEMAQKSPSSKSQAAVKGEAKTIQKAEVHEEIDPVEKTFKGMYLKVASNIPARNKEGEQQLMPRVSKEELGAPKGFETFSIPAVTVHLPGQKEQANPQIFNFTDPNQAKAPQEGNPTPILQKNTEQKQLSTPVQDGSTPAGTMQGQATANRAVPQPVNTPPLPGDPAKIAKGNQHIGKVPDITDHKHAHPRRDLIPGVDRNDNAAATLRQRHDDDRTIVRIPILPDLPLSREGILKDSGGKKGARLKEDEGFKLGDVVLMMLCAVICNARNTTEMAAYLEGREHFFKAWLGLKKGLPTHRLLTLLMKRLKPDCLNQLIQLALAKSTDLSALQSVGVWESDRGFVLAELKVDVEKKSHAPLADALRLFDLSDSIATIDAEILDKNIARQIRGGGGEFLLALKGKHGEAYENVQEYFAVGFQEKRDEIRHEVHRDVVKEGKAALVREIMSVEDVSWFELQDDWTGLRTTVRFLSETVKENRTMIETRTYLSSLPMDAKAVAKTLRIHSTLENKLAWYLDLDVTRGDIDHRQENFDSLRAYSWNLLNLESTVRATPELKSNKAKTDNSYLRSILGTKAA